MSIQECKRDKGSDLHHGSLSTYTRDFPDLFVAHAVKPTFPASPGRTGKTDRGDRSPQTPQWRQNPGRLTLPPVNLALLFVARPMRMGPSRGIVGLAAGSETLARFRKSWPNGPGRLRMSAPNSRSAQALETWESRRETRPWVTVRPSRARTVGRHPRRSDQFQLGCCRAWTTLRGSKTSLGEDNGRLSTAAKSLRGAIRPHRSDTMGHISALCLQSVGGGIVALRQVLAPY